MNCLDQYAIHDMGIPASVLMENAGKASYDRVKKLEKQLSRKTISVFCGPGNNGGDGYVFARYAHLLRARVYVWIVSSGSLKFSYEAQTFYNALEKQGVPIFHFATPNDLDSKHQMILDQSYILIDAIFGTGLSRDLSSPYSDWIEHINLLKRQTRLKKVYSLDLPSGLHADSGKVMGSCIKADATITFVCKKRGLFFG